MVAIDIGFSINGIGKLEVRKNGQLIVTLSTISPIINDVIETFNVGDTLALNAIAGSGYIFKYYTKQDASGTRVFASIVNISIPVIEALDRNIISAVFESTAPPAPAPGCDALVSQYGDLLRQYDVNRNGKIDKEEATQAGIDYFNNKINKDQAAAITNAYYWVCTFTPSTAPPVVPPAATIPTIFNICWKVGLSTTGACAMPPDMPAMKAGDITIIKADISNSGPSGKVRVIFKIDGAVVTGGDQNNPNLGTFPGGGLWSPSVTYTMPNRNVTLVVEAHGWDGTKWILSDTKTLTISVTAPVCTSISLSPFSASLDPFSTDPTKKKVTLTATVTPITTSFPVIFKDSTGLVLGTCNTSISTGKCIYVFDSTGKSAGTYYITAITGACQSTSAVIEVAAPISQWTLGMLIKDINTGMVVTGATVLVATAGKPSQTKTTNGTGSVSFIIDQGSVSITISKSGYNTLTDSIFVFNNVSKLYELMPTPPPPPPGGVPVPGSIQFVSIPVGARVYIDGTDTSQVTPITISNISSGVHNFTLKLSGYNDLSGTTTVQSGSVVSVYVTMTVSTPTTGSLNITSHPVMGAKIFIDNRDTELTTSASTRITEIPPGNHTYKLTLSGYKDATGPFLINAGSTTFLDIELTPLPTVGSVEITSTPSGARIYLDETNTNRVTPASILNLSAGSHSYKLILSGYRDATGNFNIIAGQTISVDVILEVVLPTTGTLEISSNPPNARIYVDGLDTQRITPAVVPNLSEGTHTYKLILSGYKDASATFSITAGQTRTISISLEQIIGPPTRPGIEAWAAGALALVAVLSFMREGEKKEVGA
jgi:hypothetical protein